MAPDLQFLPLSGVPEGSGLNLGSLVGTASNIQLCHPSLDALPHMMTQFSPSQHLPLIQSPPQHYLRRCHFSASQGVFLFKISTLPQILPPYLAQIACPCLYLLPMCPLWPPESGLPTHCSSPTKNNPHTHLFFILLTLPVSASMPPPPGSPPCFVSSSCPCAESTRINSPS